jgi:hypothetical protein
MQAVRIRKRLESSQLDLPELSPFVGKTVEIIVLEEPESPAPARQPRTPGSAAGQITMSDDFNDPLEDFEPYT